MGRGRIRVFIQGVGSNMHMYVQTIRCPISEDNGNQRKSWGTLNNP